MLTTVLRCIRCNAFVGRFRGQASVFSTVNHSDEAAKENDVVACSNPSCGLLHEIERNCRDERAA